MMTRILLTALALTGSTASSAEDARVRTRFYDPVAIVPVVGRSGFQSTIMFAPDERIENVAIGDSAAWQVTPNKRANLLFLKPVLAHARTNMTVVTDRRTYMFDLKAAAGGAAALYALRFTYPEPIARPDDAEDAPGAKPLPVAAPAPNPLGLNFAWEAKGAKRLLPARSFDDGKLLFLTWPKDVSVPAILAIGPDGSEGPVNYAVQGNYIVIDGVPPKLVLRAGKEHATLTSPAAGPQPATRSAER